MYGFGPASRHEKTVFGAQRPGYPSRRVSLSEVRRWLSFMKEQKVRRVCCLLSEDQLSYYEVPLLSTYQKELGEDRVCWAPVEDFYLCGYTLLKERILPFLNEADERAERAVVHCSGGSLLHGWLLDGPSLQRTP